MRLAGRTAIMTGAGSGIGRASAALFAKRRRQCCAGRSRARGLQETLGDRGPRAERRSHVGDVGEADLRSGRGDVMARLGRLDMLMAAAGFSCGGTVLTTDPADRDAVFRTNVGGTWLWSRAAVPRCSGRGSGSIITLASQLAIAGGKGNSAYIAAKGAIISLTRTMAWISQPTAFASMRSRRAPSTHRCCGAVLPVTPIPTPVRETSRNRHAMKRFGQAEEVAETALHLASDASSFTTGTVMVVDGGWLAA